jgi:hypothetical protein
MTNILAIKMNPIIGIGLVIVSIGVIGIILSLIVMLYKKLFNPKSLLEPKERLYNVQQLAFLCEIERMHEENESLLLSQANRKYSEINQTDLDHSKSIDEIMGISGWEESPKKSDAYICGSHLQDLLLDLNRRFVVEKFAFDLKNETEVLNEYGVNIKESEFLVYKTSNLVDLYEEKTRTTSISYSGISTNFQSGPIRYRMGNLKPIPHREDYWQGIDRCNLYILTNKLIFVGTVKKKNKTIKIDDIITGEYFSNGILLSLANSKKILLDFPEFKNSTLKRDDKNIFSRVLERVIKRNYENNLLESPERISEIR